MRKILTNYHVSLSHGGEATKERKKERFKTMGPKKTSRHSKRVWQPSAWSFEPYDVENCHAIVHSKKVNMSRLEYARLFGATIKESVKRTASWASYYNTSRKSKHPSPTQSCLSIMNHWWFLYLQSTFLQMTATSYETGPQHMFQ